MVGCQRLVIIKDDASPVAFAASNLRWWNSYAIYHLEGIIVAVQEQGTGLARALLEEELRATRAGILAFHTQNTKMWKLGEKVAVFSEKLARSLAMIIHSRNPDGIIDKMRYGGNSLYGDGERFEKIAIPDIDWRRGDAKIFAGWVRR